MEKIINELITKTQADLIDFLIEIAHKKIFKHITLKELIGIRKDIAEVKK